MAHIDKGVRENAASFSVPDLCSRPRRGRALYDALSPYNQNDLVEVRKTWAVQWPASARSRSTAR